MNWPVVHKVGQDGHFIAPTVFGDVAPDSALAQEEIFGPVLSMLRARDQEHASIANGTDRSSPAGAGASKRPAWTSTSATFT